MTNLSLYLLGPPRVELDGIAIEVSPRKALALLIYLAVTAVPHTRDSLATLLWPESDQRRARRALRNRLSELKQAVGGSWIDAGRETIGLQPGCWLDTAEFQNALAGEEGDAESLSEAAALYRDDFLAGFTLPDCPEYDEWHYFQSESLRQDLAAALDRLVGRLSDSGDYETAVPHARRRLALDPLHEPACRRLMRLYALAGQQSAALRQYELCLQTFEEELGISPAPETTALFEQIRDRKFGLAETAVGNEMVVVPPPFLSTPTRPHTPSMPFVARERELGRLDHYLDSALNGQGRVIFVTGEAGSGKTALVDEFTRQLMKQESNLIVAGGVCQAYSGMGDPYLPFRQILRLLTGDVETRWQAGTINREHAQRLWALMPASVGALLGVAPDLIDIFISGSALLKRATMAAPEYADWPLQLEQVVARKESGQYQDGLKQHNLFEQYTRLLQTLAHRNPLLLVLDDLQWADAGSINLLFHLGRLLDGHRILIVGIYRPADVALGRGGERHPLTPVINEFARYFGQIEINLKQASDQQFVEQLLDTEPNRLDDEFRQELFQHSNGHALFTIELLRGLQERGELIKDKNGQWVAGPALNWDTLPARVESVIGERIGRLPATLLEVLKVASVAGENFTAEVVASVQGVHEREMIRWLSGQLDIQHHLVRASGSEQVEGQRLSHYRFQHILFQHYLYSSLDAIERTYLHEALGLALEQLYGERAAEVALQLARHFEAAGLPAKTITYLQAAGDAAAQLYAGVEAAAHYYKALALAEQEQVAVEIRFALYTRLGNILELDSQFDQALAIYSAMEALAHEHNDEPMRLSALTSQAAIHAAPYPGQDLARAETLSEQALVLARELGERAAEAKILSNLLNIYRYSNRMSEAIAYGERALALTRELNLTPQMAVTLNDLARLYGLSGHLDQSDAFAREAITLLRELGNQPSLVDSLASACAFSVYAGDFDQVIAYSQEAWQISQAMHNIWDQSYSVMTAGYAYWERGEVDKALMTMEDSIRLSKEAGFVVPQVLTQADLAAVYAQLGDFERGFEAAQLALAAAETKIPVYRGLVLAALAHLHLLNGKLVEAEATIEQYKEDPYRGAIPFIADLIVLPESELMLKQDRPQQTLLLTESYLNTLLQFGMKRPIPDLLLLRGQAFRALGQADWARDSLREARTVAEAMTARCSLWPILFELSQLESDPLEADSLRRQARQIVKDIIVQITAPDLRASFLAKRQVSRVLEPVADE